MRNKVIVGWTCAHIWGTGNTYKTLYGNFLETSRMEDWEVNIKMDV